jgi:hypothetical protein
MLHPLIFRIRKPADEKQMRVRTLLAQVRVHRCLKRKASNRTVIINLTLDARVTILIKSALIMDQIEMLYKSSL